MLKIFFREELEKQRAAANYQRLHAKGKTEEARADLARLAIIKAQREEAAKKRAEEAKSEYHVRGHHEGHVDCYWYCLSDNHCLCI